MIMRSLDPTKQPKKFCIPNPNLMEIFSMNIPLPIYITIYKFMTIIMRVCFDILTSALYHHSFSLIPKAQSGFSFSILWGSWIGDHPQEDLAKFGYREKSKFNNKNLLWNMSLWTPWTYGLKMEISTLFPLKTWWLFQKILLYNSQPLFFANQVLKFHHQNKKKPDPYGFKCIKVSHIAP
jgi:hypothetical protein